MISLKHSNDTTAIEPKFTYKSIVKKLEYFCLIGFALEIMFQFFISPSKTKFHVNSINQINAIILIAFYSFYINDSTPHFLVVILLLKGYIFFNTNKMLTNQNMFSLKLKNNILVFLVYLIVCFIFFLSLSYYVGLILINENQKLQIRRFFSSW